LLDPQSASADSRQISQGKALNWRCVDAGFITHTPARMEDFAVTCPLVPGVPHLVSGSCASPRIFGLGFLQTPPRGDALALLLAFGCANIWHGDLHLASSVPCPAHTPGMSRAVYRVRSSGLILMEAPSSAVPPWDCWRWVSANTLKRRRPQALLHHAAPMLRWH
jgi:hypothetical protein